MLVSRPKAKRELSKLTLTQEASLKDLEGGARNSAAAVIWALRKVCRDRRWSHLKKVRNKGPRSYYGFLFISAVRFVSIPTLYINSIIYILCRFWDYKNVGVAYNFFDGPPSELNFVIWQVCSRHWDERNRGIGHGICEICTCMCTLIAISIHTYVGICHLLQFCTQNLPLSLAHVYTL